MSQQSAPPATGTTPTAPTANWVPVEQRLLGFDRRTLWPRLLALAIWVIWASGVPAINSAIEFDNPVVAGDVIDLGDQELTLLPALGWNLVGAHQ
jgi:hypothetical protein